MRTGLDATTDTLYTGGDFDVYTRLKIENGDDTPISLEGRYFNLNVKLPDPREPIGSLSVDLIRELTLDGTDSSLAPLVENSTFNKLDDTLTYSPLVQLGRVVTLDVILVTTGDPRPGDADVRWYEIFKGIVAKVSWPKHDKNSLRIHVNGLAAQLQIQKSEAEYTYAAGSSIETVVSDILTNNSITGVTTYFPSATGKVLSNPYAPGLQKSIWEQMQSLANSMGWVVYYRYRGTGSAELTFFEPARAKVTPDMTVTTDDFSSLSVDESEVRNVGYLVFVDANGAEQLIGPTENAASIIKYGGSLGLRRPFWIKLDAASPIRDSTSASEMLTAAVSDVADPDVVASLSTFPLVFAESGIDLYTVPSQDRFFDTAQTWALFGCQLSFAHNKEPRSKASLRGVPTAGTKTWRDLATDLPTTDSQIGIDNAYLRAVPHVDAGPSTFAGDTRPDSDVDNTDGWTENGVGTNLYEVLDESTFDDADYCESPQSLSECGSGTDDFAFTIGLSNPGTAPATSSEQTMVLRTRLRRGTANAGTADFLVELLETSTVIASFTHNNVGTSFTQFNDTLSNAEVDAIGNHNNLRVRITATVCADNELNPITAQVSWCELAYTVKTAPAVTGVLIDLVYDPKDEVDDFNITVNWDPNDGSGVSSYSYTKTGIGGVSGTERLQGPGASDFFMREDWGSFSVQVTPVAQPNSRLGLERTYYLEDATESGAGSKYALSAGGTVFADYAVSGTNVTIDTDANGRPRINATGGAAAINDLSDVTITSPVINQHLQYDGAAWVNVTDMTIADGFTLMTSGGTEAAPSIRIDDSQQTGFYSTNGTSVGLTVQGDRVGNLSRSTFAIYNPNATGTSDYTGGFYARDDSGGNVFSIARPAGTDEEWVIKNYTNSATGHLVLQPGANNAAELQLVRGGAGANLAFSWYNNYTVTPTKVAQLYWDETDGSFQVQASEAASSVALVQNGDKRVEVTSTQTLIRKTDATVAFLVDDAYVETDVTFRPQSVGDLDLGSSSLYWNSIFSETHDWFITTTPVAPASGFGRMWYEGVGVLKVRDSGGTTYTFDATAGSGFTTAGAGLTSSGSTVAVDYLGADSIIATAPAGSIVSSDEILFMDVDDTSNVKRDLVSSLPFASSTHTHPASDITADTFGAGAYTFPDNVTVNDKLLLGSSPSNANQTIGVTIDQGINTNEAFSIKATGRVAHGYTTAAETAVFFTMKRYDDSRGGAQYISIAESTNLAGIHHQFLFYGGDPQTSTPAATSVAAVDFFFQEHDGAGALRNATANANIYSFRARDAGGVNRNLLLLRENGEAWFGGQLTTQSNILVDNGSSDPFIRVSAPSSIYDAYIEFDEGVTAHTARIGYIGPDNTLEIEATGTIALATGGAGNDRVTITDSTTTVLNTLALNTALTAANINFGTGLRNEGTALQVDISGFSDTQPVLVAADTMLVRDASGAAGSDHYEVRLDELDLSLFNNATANFTSGGFDTAGDGLVSPGGTTISLDYAGADNYILDTRSLGTLDASGTGDRIPFSDNDTNTVYYATPQDIVDVTAITESQITDGSILARVAANETITGTWTFPNTTDIGVTSQSYDTLAATDWDRGVGTHVFVNAATSTGEPSGASRGYWFTMGRRDTQNGYAGLYLELGNTLWLGERDDNTVDGAPTWVEVANVGHVHDASTDITTGTLPVARGGTGIGGGIAADQFLIGDGTANPYVASGTSLTWTGSILAIDNATIQHTGTGGFTGDGSGLTDVSAESATVAGATVDGDYYPMLTDTGAGVANLYTDTDSIRYNLSSGVGTLEVDRYQIGTDGTMLAVQDADRFTTGGWRFQPSAPTGLENRPAAVSMAPVGTEDRAIFRLYNDSDTANTEALEIEVDGSFARIRAGQNFGTGATDMTEFYINNANSASTSSLRLQVAGTDHLIAGAGAGGSSWVYVPGVLRVGNELRLADGSVGDPTLAFTSGETTGLYYTTNQINWAIAGTRQMYLNSGGLRLRDPTNQSLWLHEDDANANEGNYRFVASGGDFYIQAVNDAESVFSTGLRFINNGSGGISSIYCHVTLRPDSDASASLGANTVRWNTLYVDTAVLTNALAVNYGGIGLSAAIANDELLVSTGSAYEGSGDLTYNSSSGLNLAGTGLDITISGTGRFEGDGSGLTGVAADSSTVTDLTTETATYYPIMADGSSGAISHFVDASEFSYTATTDTLNTVNVSVLTALNIGGSGTLNFGGTSSSYLNHNNISSRDKIRVWNSSFYTIGMQNSFTFGPLVTDYAMTFQMNNNSTRGFWWGDDGHGQSGGAMALSTNGYLTLARHMRLGYGEADTANPSSTIALDISMASGATTAIDINGLTTGDYILDWGGLGYTRMTKITDRGGLSIGADSSIVIQAGDTLDATVTGLGIVSSTTAEVLYLASDASVVILPNQQSAFTTAARWTFGSNGTLQGDYSGAASTPTYSFVSDSDTGMRLQATGILRLSAGTDDAYLDVDATNNRLVANRVLLINEARSELLRLDSSGAFNPYVSFYIDGNRHGYLQYLNSGEEFRFVQEESTGGFFSFYNGSPSTSTRRFVIDGLGNNVGRTYVENSQFYVEEDQTVLTVAATVTCDWDRSNQLHLTITNTVTTIAIDDDSMQPGGSYILMVQEGTSAPSSVTWSSTDTIFWANGTAPVLNGGDLNDITVVQFFKTTAGSNTRIIGSWFLAQ